MTLNFVNADIEARRARDGGDPDRQQFSSTRACKGTITLYSERAAAAARGLPQLPRRAARPRLHGRRGRRPAQGRARGRRQAADRHRVGRRARPPRRPDRSRRSSASTTRTPNNLVPVLRPLISPNNTINANPGNNSLVITDYADNLQRIGKIIAALDMPAGGDVEVIPLQLRGRLRHRAAGAAPDRRQRPAPAAVPGAAGGRRSRRTSIIVEPRSNSLIVRAPNPARMASVRALIAQARPAAAGLGAGRQHLGRLPEERRRDASSRPCCAPRSRRAAAAAAARGRRGGGRRRRRRPARPANPRAAPTGTGNAPAPRRRRRSRRRPGPSTGGFIQADPATNSLIITAPEPLYRQLRAVIDQLDARRAQVYIESLIVEVTRRQGRRVRLPVAGPVRRARRQRSASSAAPTSARTGNMLNIIGQSRRSIGTPPATPRTTAAARRRPQHRPACRNFDGTYGAGGARALPGEPDRRRNIALDAEPADARQRGGQDRRRPERAVRHRPVHQHGHARRPVNPFQTIERKDVGITLRVRPQISENGTVRMTIYQEASSLSTRSRRAPRTPARSTNKRSIESNVLVDDGQIIVLGGLIQDQLHRQQVEGAAARRHPLPRRAVPQREPHARRDQPDGVPAPGRGARRRDHEHALARPLRADPRASSRTRSRTPSSCCRSTSRRCCRRCRRSTSPTRRSPRRRARPARRTPTRPPGDAGAGAARDRQPASPGRRAGVGARRLSHGRHAIRCPTPSPRRTRCCSRTTARSCVLWAPRDASPAGARREVLRMYAVDALEREPAPTLAQRIAAAYAGGESSAATVDRRGRERGRPVAHDAGAAGGRGPARGQRTTRRSSACSTRC